MLSWAANAVGPEAKIQSVHQLAGATSSVLHSLEIETGSRKLFLVLRQFNNEAWLAEEPDLVAHEVASLQKIQHADIPTPELVAYDKTGEECGIPAILMTQLIGNVDLKPQNIDDWLHQLAEALLPIHAIDVADLPWNYQPYNNISFLEPPNWSSVPDLWAQAIEIVRGPQPKTQIGFIHRDYHPNNVLWKNQCVSGIIDWPNACCGAANIDVAWCRGNLIHLYGVAAANQFLDTYQSVAGGSFEYHPYWDLIVAIEALPGPPNIYPPWTDFGIRHLTSKMMCKNLDDYLISRHYID